MAMPTTAHSPHRLLWFLLVLLATAPTALGQAERDPLVDVDFRGGTVAEYLAAIQKAQPAANVTILDREVGEVLLPPVQLKRVRWSNAVKLIDDLVLETDEARIVIGTTIDPGDGISAPVAAVRAHVDRVRQPARSKSRQTYVWSLAHLIGPDAIGAEDVLSAMETALEVSSKDEQAATMRFHRETSLLIMHGTGNQIQAVEMIVDRLTEAQQRARQQKDASVKLESALARLADAESRASAIEDEALRVQVRAEALEREIDRRENETVMVRARSEELESHYRERLSEMAQQIAMLEKALAERK